MAKRTNSWSSKRGHGISIPVGKNVLFIYCGECTEPQYFSSVFKLIAKIFLEKSHGQTRLDYDDTIDAVDPLNMARDIKSIIESKNKFYDEVWVVFDKDSFMKDNFDNAIHSIMSMNKSSRTSFVPLWSNQCIELWFILHFEFLQSAQFRADYYPKLEKYLHKKYLKNNPNILTDIFNSKGSLESACKNAEKLLEIHKDDSYSNKWPATNVVELFKKYKNYL